MVFNRDNGIYRSVVATVVGLAVVAAALSFLIRDLSTVDSAYSHAAADATVEYERDAQAYIKEYCFSPAGLREEDCTAKAYEAAREGQRKEQDLAAQNITAWWTKVMGIAAMIGMALSAVGVWLVKATFDATREANTISRDAQRAWVTLSAQPERVRRHGDRAIEFDIDIIVENIGATVATHFDIESEIFFKGQTEDVECLNLRIQKVIDDWKAEYDMIGGSSLLPNDKEHDSFQDYASGPRLKWWHFGGTQIDVVQPIIVVAAFYRTVTAPQVIQLSWRSWYITQDPKRVRSVTGINQGDGVIIAENLGVVPYRTSLMHEEYTAKKNVGDDATQD